MAKETERSQRWNLYLAGSGLLAIMLELILSIVFSEQIFSHAPMSFQRATSLFTLFVSLVAAPVPWFGIRKGCQSLRNMMLGLGADEDAMSSLDATMGNILIFSYVVLSSCVVALARLT
jgi:hypothetical protein